MRKYYIIALMRLASCLIGAFALLALLLPVTAHADTFPIVAVLHPGRAPEALAVDTQTHMLYIANEAPGLIVGFDPLSGTVRWRTPLENSATDVQVDSSSHHVYATAVSRSNDSSHLSILDGASGKVLGTFPSGNGDNGIALDPQHHVVYVSSVSQDTIYKYTFQSGWQDGPLQVQTTSFASPHPDAIGVNSRLGRIYIANSAANLITVIDANNGHTITTIPVAALPVPPLRIDEANGRIYIVCSTGQELDVIDGNTNRMLARLPIGPYPEGMAFNTATRQLYVANEGSNEGGGRSDTGTTVTVIDGRSLTVLGNLQVGRSPDGVEADPALHRVYVATENSNAVVEITDSTNLPLTSRNTSQQIITAHQTAAFLHVATIVTLIVMFVLIVGATLGALSPRWRVRENPQTAPVAESSRSQTHTPLP